MVNLNRKRNKNNLGGYQQYRRPLVFGPKKEKPQKKKIELPKLSFKAILYIIAIIVLLYFVFLSGKFRIREVIIEGTATVANAEIEHYIPKGKNILLFNAKQTKKEILAEHTEINNILIYKGLPDTIKIVIVEHENKVVWQTGGKNYLVSSQGVVSKEVASLDGSMPIVTDSKNLPLKLGDKLVSANFVAFVLNANEKFFETTNIKPVRFEVGETTFDMNLFTEAGFYVKFNTLRSSAKQLSNLKEVLVAKRQDIHEYVDLRVDGWAYYK